MKAIRTLLLGSCALTALATTPMVATAQEAVVTAQPSALEEVVVTANKREENLQKVAATVDSVKQDDLQRQGVKEIFDLSRVMPEVQVGGGQLTQLTIRGVRTGATGPTTDSPNAVNVDGAYISRFTSIQGLFFDTQRVEVLAGPQGTLYGRNAAGGAMNIITNKPTQKFGGYVDIDYGNYNAINLNAAVNLPINEQLAVRFAYFRNKHDGYEDNGTDDADQESYRGSLKWTPTPRDTILVTLDHENVGGRLPGPSATITQVLKQPSILTAATGAVSLVAAGTAGAAIVPIVTSDPWHLGQTYGAQDLSQQHTWGDGYMGQWDHDFGWANLTFQGQYRDSYSRNRNGTTADFPQDPRLVTAGVLRPTGESLLIANAKWDSQELRLTSPSAQQFTWVGGIYRFHEYTWDDHNISYNVSYPNTSAATVGQVVYGTPLTVNRDTVNATGADDAYAAFGQGTYTPDALKSLHLTAGLRYNYETKSGTGYSLNAGTILVVPQLNAPPINSQFNLSNNWSSTTYKLNISYDITSHSLIYVDHSTGFKSGGFGFGANPAYNPETISAYEIGSKNRFFDNRLQVNVSAWHYDYKDFVSNVPDFVVDSTTGRLTQILNTSNAGGAKFDGQSIDVNAIITPNDLLTVNATHQDDKYTSFDISNRYAFYLANPQAGFFGTTAAMFNYSGTEVGGIPDWAANVTYDHLFTALGGTFDGQVSVHYVGNRLLCGTSCAVANVNAYIFGSPYALADLSVRYERDGGRWNVSAYVRNLANYNVPTAAGYTANEPYLPASDPRVTFAYKTITYGQAPRTFGLTLNVNF